MEPAHRDWTDDAARAARERHDARRARLARGERVSRRAAPAVAEPVPHATGDPDPHPASRTALAAQQEARRTAVAAALERARARRERHAP